MLVYAIQQQVLVGEHGFVLADVRYYHAWASGLTRGHGLPVHDPTWQYPPGAAAVLTAPLALPLPYQGGFVALMLLADAATLALLLARRKTTAGGWLWTLGGFALGPLLLTRFDVVPTSLAVAGLSCGAPMAAGALFGLGGWVKVWPALLALRGSGPRQTAQSLLGVACVAAAGVCVLALAGQLDRAVDFLTQQRQRGLQIESVAATPLLVSDALQGRPFPRHFAFEYGAMQVKGPSTEVAAFLCTLAGLGVLVWWCVSTVRAWRRGETLADSSWRALALLLLLMVTSRVLSPQYMIWALGLGGLVAARALRGGRVVALLLFGAALLTLWVFPSHYLDLVYRDTATTMALAARNLLLLIATVFALGHAERPPAHRPGAVLTRPRPATSSASGRVS